MTVYHHLLISDKNTQVSFPSKDQLVVLLDFGLSFIESRLHAVVVTARLELRRAIYSFYHSGCAHPSKLMDALVRGLYFGR